VGLTLTILGCSGGYPGPSSACSSYLVRSDTTTVWLDAGSGSLANLQRYINLDDIDVIVLSHEHPDHWRDIEGLYVAYRYGDAVRENIPVFAPAGLREQAYFDTEPVFAWNTVADGQSVETAGMRFSFSRTDHGPETLAVRIDAGERSMAFSADTGPAWSFDRFGPGINLALCEATLDEAHEDTVQHLSGRQAGAMAAAAGVERLVLTHFWPTHDPAAVGASAQQTFRGPLALAAIGEEYPV
jgi:ribonuclease BN (tRNA processing enzyme)